MPCSAPFTTSSASQLQTTSDTGLPRCYVCIVVGLVEEVCAVQAVVWRIFLQGRVVNEVFANAEAVTAHGAMPYEPFLKWRAPDCLQGNGLAQRMPNVYLLRVCVRFR